MKRNEHFLHAYPFFTNRFRSSTLQAKPDGLKKSLDAKISKVDLSRIVRFSDSQPHIGSLLVRKNRKSSQFERKGCPFLEVR